jgi:hypothetical protein
LWHTIFGGIAGNGEGNIFIEDGNLSHISFDLPNGLEVAKNQATPQTYDATNKPHGGFKDTNL